MMSARFLVDGAQEDEEPRIHPIRPISVLRLQLSENT